MARKTINPSTLFNSKQYGFSQIVVSKPEKMVFISGQVAWDENGNIVGENDLATQVQKAMDNLKKAMEAAGGTLEDIVMLRIYKVDYQQADSAIISAALLKYFGTVNPPASTWLSVQGLANADFMVEIEAQAVLSS